MLTTTLLRRLSFVVIGSSGFTAWWYRPIPDMCLDNDGPRREGKFMSKINLNDKANQSPPILYQFAQSIAVFATVTATRAFLIYGGQFSIEKDVNYHNFLKKIILRDKDVAIITIANHRSMFDDPSILSSLLPYWMNIQPRYLRWNVCAQEFCFNSNFPSIIHAYIGAGKTLPMWRGGGINQKLLLDFARHVAAGEWCHIFPEAGVWQKKDTLGGRNKNDKELGKLKWGVGKLIAHAPKTPIVIPFFHSGMETVIPQDPVTLKTIGLPIPQPGHNVKVIFGPELHFTDLIDEHELKYGPLHKYSVSESEEEDEEKEEEGGGKEGKVGSSDENNRSIISKNNGKGNFHSHWDSRPQDLQLYHKITLRIQLAMEELNRKSLQANQR